MRNIIQYFNMHMIVEVMIALFPGPLNGMQLNIMNYKGN